jgi:hypothetical protein
MAFELVSFDDIKDFMSLENDNLSDYPDMTVIKSSVESAVENYIGRKLESTSRTEIIFIGPHAQRMINLKALPIDSVTSLTHLYYGTSTSYTEDDDYIIMDYGVYLNAEVQNCKITLVYTGGYAEGEVPEEIQRAALIQTVHEYQTKDRVGAEYIQTQTGSIKRPPIVLLDEVKRLLAHYKHPLMII